MILLLFLLVVLSITFPVIGLVVSIIVIYVFKGSEKLTLTSLAYISFFFGIINSLKIYESDLVNYIDAYKLSEKYNALDFTFSYGKEPLFYFFTFAVNYLSNGAEAVFVVLFTMLGYFVLLYAIWKTHKHYKLRTSDFVFAVLCTLLFPSLFSLSAHLVRQFIASSFIILFLVKRFYEDKNPWYLLLIAFLFHSTSALFVFCYSPFFNTKINIKSALKFSVILGSILFFLKSIYSVLGSVFSSFPLLSYVFDRIIKINEDKVEPLGTYAILFHIIIVVIFFIISKKLRINNKSNTNFKFLYLSILLTIFILINLDNGIISLRFSFYMYFLFPLCMYFFGNIFNSKLMSLVVKIPLFFGLLFWFVHKIENGVWTYKNIEILFSRF